MLVFIIFFHSTNYEDIRQIEDILCTFVALTPVLSLFHAPQHTRHTVSSYCSTVLYTFLRIPCQMVSTSFSMQKWHLFIIYSPLYSLVVTDISKHVNVIKMHCTLYTKLKIRVQAFRGWIAGKEWVVRVTKSYHWSDSPILEMSLFNFSFTSVHISIRKLINIGPASAEATKVDCYCVGTQVQNKCRNRDK